MTSTDESFSISAMLVMTAALMTDNGNAGGHLQPLLKLLLLLLS